LARQYTLLIADRNRNVRDFLGREMVKEGYQVRQAKTGSEVLRWIYDAEPVDLLIMDPDFPDINQQSLLEKIEDRVPTLPVVVHAFASEPFAPRGMAGSRAFVEKEGGSIENLKRVVLEMLKLADRRGYAGKKEGSLWTKR
jgi:DNA-binding NtrC family response regulator